MTFYVYLLLPLFHPHVLRRLILFGLLITPNTAFTTTLITTSPTDSTIATTSALSTDFFLILGPQIKRHRDSNKIWPADKSNTQTGMYGIPEWLAMPGAVHHRDRYGCYRLMEDKVPTHSEATWHSGTWIWLMFGHPTNRSCISCISCIESDWPASTRIGSSDHLLDVALDGIPTTKSTNLPTPHESTGIHALSFSEWSPIEELGFL